MNGGASVTGMRTWIEMKLLSGVPHDQWKGSPFLVWPFKVFVPKTDLGLPSRDQTRRKNHPIFLALHWRQLLDSNPALATGDIAENQGISASRIRQILRLSTLAPEIVDTLKSMKASELSRFAETRLRGLIPLPKGQQIDRFREMQQ